MSNDLKAKRQKTEEVRPADPQIHEQLIIDDSQELDEEVPTSSWAKHEASKIRTYRLLDSKKVEEEMPS